MITTQDYYNHARKTAANSSGLDLNGQDYSPFPKEGIYLGEYESSVGLKAPALIPIDRTRGLCFLTTPENDVAVKKTMQMMALRLALALPPGLCRFTLFDATGLGSGLIALSKLSPKIKGDAILTEHKELKEALAEIKGYIPKVIQGVLGAQYVDKTLIDYNENAGDLAKPYRFIILTDFPRGLDKESGQMLYQIVKDGYKAGVYVILNFDTTFENDRKRDLDYFDPIPFLDLMTTVYPKGDRYYIHNLESEAFLHKFKLRLDDSFPDFDTIEDAGLIINDNLKKAQTAIVSLNDVLTEKRIWTKEAGNGIETPIGKVNVAEIQYLSLGVEGGGVQPDYHCLIGGSTGTGKTRLLHNVICNTAWLYSPEEIQLLLLDFKEGTEFMVYKDLPHVKVLSIKSEVEFALNVFGFLQDEIERRGVLFQQAGGVADLKRYNATGNPKLPRYLVIVDEFQKLFDSNQKMADRFSNLITDIGKRGRSFGINVILSTQGLGGVNIGASTLSEFGLRISMRLNSDMECNRIMGQGNMTPRSLTKTGESVYCPGGLAKNNVIYQVAYIPDDRIRNMIARLKEKYDGSRQGKTTDFCRYLFDGVSPAEIADNKALSGKPVPQNGPIRIYLGSPFSLVEEHISYTLQKENGYNLLMIGQDIASATSIFCHSIRQIAAQSPRESRIIVCDKTNSDSPYYGKIASLSQEFPNVTVVSDNDDITQCIESIGPELGQRYKTKGGEFPRIVLALFNVFNYRPARMQRSATSPITAKLLQVLADGPEVGIHTLCYADTYQHFSDIFSSRSLGEWRIKIELRGGDGYHIFGNSFLMAPTVTNPFTASIRTAELEDSENVKFRVYSI